MSMDGLASNKDLMKTSDGKRIVKNYNRVAAALTEYEASVIVVKY